MRLVVPDGKSTNGRSPLTKHVNRIIDCLAIQPLSVDTEGTHQTNHEGGEPMVVKQVPTGHRIDACRSLAAQVIHHDRIGDSRMIWGQHDAVTCIDRLA